MATHPSLSNLESHPNKLSNKPVQPCLESHKPVRLARIGRDWHDTGRCCQAVMATRRAMNDSKGKMTPGRKWRSEAGRGQSKVNSRKRQERDKNTRRDTNKERD